MVSMWIRPAWADSMNKENQLQQQEYETIAKGVANTFVQRWDLHPRQLENGSNICVHEPLEMVHIQAHLQGEITLVCRQTFWDTFVILK